MKYELVYILWPKFSDEGAKKAHQGIKDLLKPYISKVTLEESWGKKRLAYAIRHFLDGFYNFVVFESEPSKIKEIETKLKLQDEVIRFLLTRQERDYVKPKSKVIPKLEEKIMVPALEMEKPKVKEKKKFSREELDKKLDEILGEEVIK